MLANTNESWGVVSRSFHWLTFVLVLIQIPLGFYMVDAYEVYKIDYADDTVFMRASLAHNTLGFLFLLLVLARLSWRLKQRVPAHVRCLVSLPASTRATQLIGLFIC